MSNPEILLMDEPFGALDIKTRLQMQDLLIEIWEKFGPTILLLPTIFRKRFIWGMIFI